MRVRSSCWFSSALQSRLWRSAERQEMTSIGFCSASLHLVLCYETNFFEVSDKWKNTTVTVTLYLSASDQPWHLKTADFSKSSNYKLSNCVSQLKQSSFWIFHCVWLPFNWIHFCCFSQNESVKCWKFLKSRLWNGNQKERSVSYKFSGLKG